MKKPKNLTLQQRGIIVAIGLALTALLFGMLTFSADKTIPQEPKYPLSFEDRLIFKKTIENTSEDLSPKKSRRSQDFRVTDIEYVSGNEAHVSYNDGHTYLVGQVDFFYQVDEDVRYANITGFQILEEGKQYAKDAEGEE